MTAYAAADVSLLSQVYTDDSRVRADDEAAIQAMIMIGGHGQGGQQIIDAVTVLAESPSITVLRFTSRMTPFSVVSASGQVLSRQPATGSVVQEVNLVSTPGGWRVSQITQV